MNTEKGRTFFKSLVPDLEVIERTWDEFMTNGGMYPCHKRKDNDKAYEFCRAIHGGRRKNVISLMQ